MNSYSSLRTVANIFSFIGWLCLVVGVCFTLFIFSFAQDRGSDMLLVGLGYTLLAAICTVLTVAFNFDAAQFIKLCVRVADNIENINDNIYVVASKVEKATVLG